MNGDRCVTGFSARGYADKVFLRPVAPERSPPYSDLIFQVEKSVSWQALIVMFTRIGFPLQRLQNIRVIKDE